MGLQAKIDALPANGGLIRVDHDEIITKPIVIDDRHGVRIIGDSYDCQIFARLDEPGPVFVGRDMRACEIANLRIVADGNCTAGILLGRSDPHKMCYYNHLHDLQIVGECSMASLATFGAESLHVDRVYAANERNNAYTYITGDNVIGDYGSVPAMTGQRVANSVISLQGCTFLSNGKNSVTMVIAGTVNWSMRGGFIRNRHGDAGGKVQKGTAGIAFHSGINLTLDGIKQEGSDTEFGVMVSGECKRLRIVGSRLHGETAFVVMPSGSIQNCVIDMTNELISQGQHKKPYRVDGENVNSRIEVGAHP